jgi:hypothetical protein
LAVKLAMVIEYVAVTIVGSLIIVFNPSDIVNTIEKEPDCSYVCGGGFSPLNVVPSPKSQCQV